MAKPKQGAIKSAKKPGRQVLEVVDLPAPRVTDESAVMYEGAATHEIAALHETAATGRHEMPRGTTSHHDLVVLDTIARELDVQRDHVTGDVDLHIDLGIGEDQIPHLLTAMGEALDVRFPDDFLDGVTTVAQLTAAVRVSLSPL